MPIYEVTLVKVVEKSCVPRVYPSREVTVMANCPEGAAVEAAKLKLSQKGGVYPLLRRWLEGVRDGYTVDAPYQFLGEEKDQIA